MKYMLLLMVMFSVSGCFATTEDQRRPTGHHHHHKHQYNKQNNQSGQYQANRSQTAPSSGTRR